MVAVGTALSGGPPRRSVRAELPHTALTSGVWRRSDRSDADAGSWAWGCSDPRVARSVPTAGDGADCDVATPAARTVSPPAETSPAPACCQGWRGSCSNPAPPPEIGRAHV